MLFLTIITIYRFLHDYQLAKLRKAPCPELTKKLYRTEKMIEWLNSRPIA